MSILQIKRGVNAKTSAYTGAIGELVMDTTNKRLIIHDGSTKGGIPLPKQSEVPTKISQLTNDVNFSQLNTATATVDANIGTPSVTVSVTGSGNNKGLKFDFKNLKGATGAKGAAGAAGAKGENVIQDHKVLKEFKVRKDQLAP